MYRYADVIFYAYTALVFILIISWTRPRAAMAQRRRRAPCCCSVAATARPGRAAEFAAPAPPMPAPPLDTTPLLKPAAPPPLRTVGGGSSADAQPWWDTDPDQGLHRHRCCGDRLPEEEDRTAGRCRGGLCGGVRDDYRRRCPMYWRDLRSGLRAKTLSAAIFMFIATFCSTVSLGM
eukprot:SAG31_NODE_1143_length_9694_cov_5.541011_5_plen_177_part_00